jgi:hypothetical protein
LSCHTFAIFLRNFLGPNLSAVPAVRVGWLGIINGVAQMTGHTNLVVTPRDRFLRAAEQELAVFEKREREFREQDRNERAEKLQLPAYGYKRFMDNR